jgi:hypothetical protein
MYIENKDGEIDGAVARVGWVEFSKSGLTVYYRGRTLSRSKGGGIAGNHIDADTGEEYWVSGIKKKGCNFHRDEPVKVVVDEDAKDEYQRIKKGI